ncbi:50S ribosomal protein L32 [Candidatus Woesebacteria bacterium RBG_16_36_11]|uniref:Large ribosomal subunit protein bL32 n=2 Tax=Candidatus Woeseibacteriota TaxID=1752722 RepID=A0A1F7X770_9BACT|nr:MAG: 50S ribosomal protein L32 [Candidatus Woesebacteria bacterium RBG_16_36_11]OGM16884.1 MAG: 50S ribosomal protein L32 [Candidatus Woesebacteria bacterium RBG_19FT_COMBO_37_29]
MAPQPKRKHTRRRSNLRKNSKSNALRFPTLVVCSSCKKLKEPHKACPNCGFYK